MTTVIDRKDLEAPAVGIGLLHPDELPALLAMVGRCSRETLFHRFHGFTDGIAYTGQLGSGGVDEETIVAWSGGRCVGFATLAGAADDAHLSVLVEDGWQRRGVGSRLIAAVIDSARARHLARVNADVLAEDSFILRMVSRFARVHADLTVGGYSADITIDPPGGILACRPTRLV